MIDLNPNHLGTVRAILAEHVPECEVWAFGSRATWTAKDYSDLDLTVVGKGPLDWKTLGRLREAFEDSDLPIRVDVLDWHSISESFRKVIKRVYAVVQEEDDDGKKGGWQMRTLGELTDNFDAIRVPIKRRDRHPGPHPYYGASGVVDHVSGFLFDGQYLLVAEDGENLRTRTMPIAFLANGKFWVNNHAHIVRGNSDADTRFLMYALADLDISGYLTGSTMPKLTQGNMNRIELLTPLLPEQRAIAHVLGTLDDKIELNRRMNETLEETARALFKSWFVDFEPVRAKMDGRWRRGESLPGLPAEHYDLFPDRLVDSELGEIPEGWGVKEFGELLDDVIGGDWGKDSPDPENTEAVSIIRGTDLPHLRNGGVGAVPLRYTTEKKVKRRMLQDGDIVIEVSGGSPSQPTGRSMIVTKDVLVRFPTKVVCASFCRRFRPRSWAEGLLAYQHLDYSNSVGKMWEYQLQSTGISNFQTKRFLDEELVLWPTDSLAVAFSDLISPIVRQITSNESRTLAEKRDALLPRLVSGEIKVRGG